MQRVPKTATQMVAEAKQRIENLTPEQVAAELERGSVLLVPSAPSRSPKGRHKPSALSPP